MNRILWVDKRNMTARVQAGVVGLELEKAVRWMPRTCLANFELRPCLLQCNHC